MHEWMVDNGLSPHLVVDARRDGVDVPADQASEGKIVLNVSHNATRGLALGNELVAFETRFAGVPRSVSIPVGAILGIYARETGQGMVFGEETPPSSPPTTPSPPGGSGDVHGEGERKPKPKPKLKVVK
jgi:stringent starvation protein B